MSAVITLTPVLVDPTAPNPHASTIFMGPLKRNGFKYSVQGDPANGDNPAIYKSDDEFQTVSIIGTMPGSFFTGDNGIFWDPRYSPNLITFVLSTDVTHKLTYVQTFDIDTETWGPVFGDTLGPSNNPTGNYTPFNNGPIVRLSDGRVRMYIPDPAGMFPAIDLQCWECSEATPAWSFVGVVVTGAICKSRCIDADDMTHLALSDLSFVSPTTLSYANLDAVGTPFGPVGPIGQLTANGLVVIIEHGGEIFIADNGPLFAFLNAGCVVSIGSPKNAPTFPATPDIVFNYESAPGAPTFGDTGCFCVFLAIQVIDSKVQLIVDLFQQPPAGTFRAEIWRSIYDAGVWSTIDLYYDAVNNPPSGVVYFPNQEPIEGLSLGFEDTQANVIVDLEAPTNETQVYLPLSQIIPTPPEPRPIHLPDPAYYCCFGEQKLCVQEKKQDWKHRMIVSKMVYMWPKGNS